MCYIYMIYRYILIYSILYTVYSMLYIAYFIFYM